ncbi:MAG: SDR family NAD(P)-dependent oxidoreductase [Thermoanaerobaculia bacterium]
MPGRRVLITGGTSGIGLALAAALRRAGDRVLICGRNRERLEETAARLGVDAVPCDLADPTQLPALVETARERLGGLDVLIHNAGIQRAIDLTDERNPALVDGSLTREVDVNLAGPIHLTALALPLLRESDKATLVFVTSGLALAPKPSAPVYSATKAALRSFAKAIRHQLRPHGVRVLEVVPPVVDTAMTAGRDEDKVSPDSVARGIAAALDSDREELRIGKARTLFTLHRLAPGLAEKILSRQ